MTANNFFLKTLNGGTNWTQVPFSGLGTRILFINDTTGFIYGDTIIYRTTDAGNSFQEVFTSGGSFRFFKSLNFPTQQIGYAAMYNWQDSVLVFKTMDAGQTWNYSGSIAESFIDAMSIYFTDVNTGFIATNLGEVYKTTNASQNWTLMFTATSGQEINELYFPSVQYGYGVTAFGHVVRTSDGGNNWIESVPPFSPAFYSVYCISESECHAVGGNGINTGTLIKTIDYGASWSQTGTSAQTFNSVFFINDSTGYTCGTNGTILKYNGSGSVSIDEMKRDEIVIYPNPVTEEFQFTIPSDQLSSVQKIEIVNMFGQQVKTISFNQSQNSVNISELNPGTYLLKVSTESEVWVRSVIKL